MSHIIIPTDILMPDETPVLILRRHPIVLVFIGAIGIGLLTIGIVTLLFQWSLLTLIGEKIFWMLFSFYSIISLLCMMILWVNVELDFLIFTNQRLISISQKSLLSREIVTLNLADIQEVRSSVSGIFPTIFWYGNLSIFTAGNPSTIHFSHIPSPLENSKSIHAIIQNHRQANPKKWFE